MSDILSRIIRKKQIEVERRKEEKKISDFEAAPFFNRIGKSLKKALLSAENSLLVIAEFQRRTSFSETDSEAILSVQALVRKFVAEGVIAISVATEKEYFGGKLADLKMSRQVTESPLIRKDFIIDEFQLFEAKANGADVILLKAEILDTEQILALTRKAKEIGLEVMLEVNSAQQLEQLNEMVDIVCINTTNIETQEVNFQLATDLAKQVPSAFLKVGVVSKKEDIQFFSTNLLKGFVVSNFIEIDNSEEE